MVSDAAMMASTIPALCNDSMNNVEPKSEDERATISASKFLEQIPPGESRELNSDEFEFRPHELPTFHWPVIALYCSNTKCAGFRFADPGSSEARFSEYNDQRFLWCTYSCRNCRNVLKVYAISLTSPPERAASGVALKVGEYPVFGPHLPPGVIELLGEDAGYFLKGHRSEAQGLGIAAFAYYRRVVQSQRTRIFDEIISAAEHVGSDTTMVERLRHLRQHWRFQQSVDEIKDCLPQILLIEGKNPLELLHPVLSDSIHDRSDEEALEIASEIRLVLINLAERIAVAKTQSDELKQAVAKLAARKAERRKVTKTPT
jgi:hypothetical protein